jgi:hypothetical protein
MKRLLSFAVSLLLMGSTGLVLAQDAAPATTDSPAANAPAAQGAKKGGHPRIKEVRARIQDQYKRVHEGIKAKKITKDEAKDLKAKIDAVRGQMKADIQQNGKKELTEDQLNQLNQMLDDNSKAIYGEKHDGDAAASGNPSSSAAPADASTTPVNP